MSFKDHPNSRGPKSDGASRPAGERSERRGSDRPRGNSSFGARDERGPRREGGFGGGDRPRFNDRNDRGPRQEGGFGGGDRPRFNRDDRGPRPERSFGDRPRREEGGFGHSDRPRFNDGERAPRREGGFGGGDRPRFNKERGPRREGSAAGERPRFNKERSFGGDRARPNEVREERPDYSRNEGEIRRSFSGIRTYRAPAALKGKAAPIKITRPEDKFGDKE